MANLRICEGGLRWCYIFIRLLIANGRLMVRALVAIVMQILIISLIKALKGGKRGGWVGLTELTVLHVLTPTRQGFSHCSQTGDLGLRGIWLLCEGLVGLRDWGWAFESLSQVTYIDWEHIMSSKPEHRCFNYWKTKQIDDNQVDDELGPSEVLWFVLFDHCSRMKLLKFLMK